MKLTEEQKKELIIKAAIDLGPLYKYTIKNSGIGLALIVDAGTKKKATCAREAIADIYEGLRTIVIYNTMSGVDKYEH